LKQGFLYLLITFLFFFSAKAQRDLLHVCSGINGSAELNYFGVYVAPAITLDYYRHSISIGPVFNAFPYYLMFPKKENKYYPNSHQFYGGRISYDNFLFIKKKFVNIYVSSNLTYHHAIFSEYENSTTHKVQQIENKAEFLALYLGIGNNSYLSPNFYINYGVNWGFTLFENFDNNNVLSIPDRGKLSNTMVIRLGIGFTLKNSRNY
jgi:hypothetical protein